MVCTTFLHNGDLDQPTGDDELDELLADAKKLTKGNYQIVTRREYKAPTRRRWFLAGTPKREVSIIHQLYLEVGGIGPWQEFGCASNTDTVRAYLIGLINGARCVTLNTKITHKPEITE